MAAAAAAAAPSPAAAASALSVSSAASSSLESFDCWRHLVQAYSGPGPLCLLFEEEEEEEDDADEEEEEKKRKNSAQRCWRPVTSSFSTINGGQRCASFSSQGRACAFWFSWHMCLSSDAFSLCFAPVGSFSPVRSDVPAPRGFFMRPSGASGSAGARGLARKHPLHALQHLMHAVLYHRDFDTPVEHGGVRLFSARRPAAEAEGRLFRALAAQHGARPLEDNVDGLGSCGYFLFGVQLIQPFIFHPSFVLRAAAMDHAAQDATDDTASASNALGAVTRRRGRGRARRQKVGEAEEEEDNEALVDLTADAAAAALPPPPQPPKQQRQRRQQMQTKPDVLRRTVQRRVKH